MWALGAVFSARACKTASNREFRVASVFHSALGRSEAGGGRNALSHRAEEKAGACGKREWGGYRFSLHARADLKRRCAA